MDTILLIVAAGVAIVFLLGYMFGTEGFRQHLDQAAVMMLVVCAAAFMLLVGAVTLFGLGILVALLIDLLVAGFEFGHWLAEWLVDWAKR